eukprot:5319686-Lingulodinium_polyedra.AAC.1
MHCRAGFAPGLRSHEANGGAGDRLPPCLHAFAAGFVVGGLRRWRSLRAASVANSRIVVVRA